MTTVSTNYSRTALLAIMLIMILTFNISTLAQLQINTPEDLVTYHKKSNFIKDLDVPVIERGLRGITTDSDGNVWFLHSTNKTSTIFELAPETSKFTEYPVKGETVADVPVINLAAGQLVFDKERDAIWFTDARVNSLGKLERATGQVTLWQIPTMNAGPMGIALSPDAKSLWFTEITGDKLASFDIQSEMIAEYSTGEDSGPALLAFDEKGQLWVSLSFAHSILLAQIGNPASNRSVGMIKMSLQEPDRFSPFGIAIAGGKVYISDHGSSRIIVADENSGLMSYDTYWTSPSTSQMIPTTLPGQMIVDNRGNVYFPQHGGNRISEIRQVDGLMTEYEIPTGPLSTVLFLTAPDNGRVWFTEWASNKVAYLDTSKQVPFEEQVKQETINLTESGAATLSVLIDSIPSGSGNSSSLSLSEVEVGLIGITESGITGVTYHANPPRINLQENASGESSIQLQTQDNAESGSYTAMVRIQAPELDGLVISRLYPIKLVLDIPTSASQRGGPGGAINQLSTPFDVRDLVRVLAVAAIVGLVGFIVYRRVRRKPALSKY